MAEVETKEAKRPRAEGTITVPMSALLALSSFLGGGGVGGVITSRDVASELREFRAENKGELEQVRALIRELGRDGERHATAVGDHEQRLRVLELWRARTEKQ